MLPVAAERRIVRVDEHGHVLGARRSPKRATAVAVFDKLRTTSAVRTRRRLGDVPGIRGERRLVDVLGRVSLRTPDDIFAALPTLPLEPFSTREIAALLRCSTLLAQRTLYCLRTIGIVEPAGKRGHAPLYARTARDLSGDGSRARRIGARRGQAPADDAGVSHGPKVSARRR